MPLPLFYQVTTNWFLAIHVYRLFHVVDMNYLCIRYSPLLRVPVRANYILLVFDLKTPLCLR